MIGNEGHNEKFGDCNAYKMSSAGTEKLQTTDTSIAPLCLESQPRAPWTPVAKGDVPAMSAPSASHGTEPQFTKPQTPLAKGDVHTLSTPSASHGTEPQSTNPQTAVAKGDVLTISAPSASHGTEPQSTKPQTAVAKEDPTMYTPNRSHKELEPQSKIPRRTPAEEDVTHKIREARQRVQEKKEVLRKLNMAKTYRTKWETQDLSALTDQWLDVCQTALEDLRARLKEGFTREAGQQELTLKTLLDNLGIDPELVHLNEEEDCFFT